MDGLDEELINQNEINQATDLIIKAIKDKVPAVVNYIKGKKFLIGNEPVWLDFYFFEDVVRVTKSAEATSLNSSALVVVTGSNHLGVSQIALPLPQLKNLFTPRP